MMLIQIAEGLLIPFLGTALGSAAVLMMKKQPDRSIRNSLNGFSSGVMIASAVWSLLIPAIEQSARLDGWAFIPAGAGYCLGVLFLLAMDSLSAWSNRSVHGNKNGRVIAAESSCFDVDPGKKNGRVMLAVVLHNIPEGMAVGAVYAGILSGISSLSVSAAFALAVGIAIQNIPEGAIISLPLASDGASGSKALLLGVLSGAVEPIAGLLTVLAAKLLVPVLPFLLSFAAGAMFCVVIAELIPEMSKDGLNSRSTLFFMLGFSLMMALDVALG